MHFLLLLTSLTPVFARSITNSTCKPTCSWPGFSNIKHAFVFGDSYTQTGFNTTLTPPSPSNPMGNPPYPGWTSSNGPNWIDYLTTTYNRSTLLTYNLAYGGATIDASLVAPYQPSVLSVSDQVRTLWKPAYAGKPFWKGSDSVFLFWDGVNDVGNSWWMDVESLYTKIFEVYKKLVEELYVDGARNFAFLNTPPVERSPLASANDAWSIATERDAIGVWNRKLGEMAAQLKTEHGEANVWVTDTNALFNKVLDDPGVYSQTRGLRNTTGYCADYQNGTPKQDTFIESCGVPVNQYFWLNSLHPTSAMQEVVAWGVGRDLEGPPGVC
ncbi:SGNH hydrolase [Glarea lozoyensis ATCC 20868]|uniref:SGNH hydrolase n=1 Tax=Glarea lozoyensis (strain ATCC 20868 / MF5171) TaxID=1116229 RepID=S3DZ45_GLAL2|nr:SGNH hydrolase [Glarea lozoyensis ATCC 20868]EPE31613.1 SGNH hydrolase [Glarea lozoyensis ATCC 20868]